MKTILKKAFQKMVETGRTSTLLICIRDESTQQQIAESLARIALPIPQDRSYKVYPDVFGIWPENIEGKNIKIQQTHEFIRKTQLKPYVASLKVGIIISAEKMTKEAQSALLKTLEEPPKNTFLILTCSTKSRILDTIISRSRVFESFDYTDQVVDLETIKKIINSNIIDRFFFIENFLKKTSKEKQEQINSINAFLENLLTYFRQQLIKRKGKETKILEVIYLIDKTRIAIEKNVNKKLALENLMINLPLRGIDYDG
ncbi:MAG: hypothetical protein ABIE03_03285 [Patescibacteria group bacterium]